MVKNCKPVTKVCAIGITVNFILFCVKLYVGLSSGSISVYSDAVNNFFDCLTSGVTLTGLILINKKSDPTLSGSVKKSEQLFTFIISAAVTFTGLYFAYNSIERFMYPTPISFLNVFAVALVISATVKLLLFAVFRYFSKTNDSPVIKALKFDSLLDFFITLMTVLSLVVSNYATFSFDALFGLIISIVIIVSAVKMLISSAANLINFVPTHKREEISLIMEQNGVNDYTINYVSDGYDTIGYVKATLPDSQDEKKISDLCFVNTGIKLAFIKE